MKYGALLLPNNMSVPFSELELLIYFSRKQAATNPKPKTFNLYFTNSTSMTKDTIDRYKLWGDANGMTATYSTKLNANGVYSTAVCVTIH